MRKLLSRLLSLHTLSAIALLAVLTTVTSVTRADNPSANREARQSVTDHTPIQLNSQAMQWADSVMSGMTLEEKIGQLCIYTLAPEESQANLQLLKKVVTEYKIGGLLFSGGNAATQVRLTNRAQSLSAVPLMITFDGEWGLAMRLKNTPKFPRNGILGCISDNRLLYDYGREVARQCREMGVQVNFAPVADVNINPKNPVIGTRSFGEQPEAVARKVTAYAKGLEKGGVLSVAKHFPGHGDTETDSHHALPVLKFTRERLDQIELVPFRRYIESGLGGIMVGHLHIPALDSVPGRPASLSPVIVDGLLKKELGFQGLVFTDALAMKGVAGSSSICLDALKAGNDLLLVPRNLQREIKAVIEAVRNGELSAHDIENRCRKVLAYKYCLGLSRPVHIRTEGLMDRLNDPEARNLIDRLHQAAITVLSNPENQLPWQQVSDTRIAIAEFGDPAALTPLTRSLEASGARVTRFPIARQAGKAWSDRLCDSLATYDRVLIALNSSKIAPFHTCLQAIAGNPRLSKATFLFFTPHTTVAACPGMPWRQGPVILAHTSSNGVPERVAEVLTGQQPADGQLAFSIGRFYPAGTGVRTGQPEVQPDRQQYTPQISFPGFSRLTERIDSIARWGIEQKAYPGCQIAVWYKGTPLYEQCYGTLDGDSSRLVCPTDLYDLASLTKTSATLLAIMKLYDMQAIRLSDRLSKYLTWLKGTDKQHITIRDVLYHQSGLPAGIPLSRSLIDPSSFSGNLYSAKTDRKHTVRVGQRLWANPDFKFRTSLVNTSSTDSCTLRVCGHLWANTSIRSEIQQLVCKQAIRPRTYRYSDTGFLLLQFLAEEITGQPLNQFVDSCFYTPMHLTHTGFCPLSRFTPDSIAPSAIDPFLRKCELRGYVHDETAAFQGGVSGNAGLFSNATEQAVLYQMLLNGGTWQGKRYLSEQTCRLFTTSVSSQSRRGLGFDRPDPNPSKSPCAPSAPASVYGHTGFTGTCAWADPDKELILVFLSNRTYPDALNRSLLQLDIRGRLQQALYESDL